MRLYNIIFFLSWPPLTGAEEEIKKENIHNVVDFNQAENEVVEEVEKNSNIGKVAASSSQMFCQPPLINNKNYDTEEFYLQYLWEFLIEIKSNSPSPEEAVRNIENTLKRMEEISVFFAFLKDLLLLEAVIENNRINITNGGFVTFDSTIVYQHINNNKYIIEVTEKKYHLLLQLLQFFGKKNIIDFFEKIKIKQYIQKEIPAPVVKGSLPLSSPIIVSKTTPIRKNKVSIRINKPRASAISKNSVNHQASKVPLPFSKTPIIQMRKKLSSKKPIISYRKKTPPLKKNK
jgi:hypothetical protein